MFANYDRDVVGHFVKEFLVILCAQEKAIVELIREAGTLHLTWLVAIL